MLLDQLVLYHALDLLWVVLGDISDTLSTRPYESLECQVVARCQWIVLVGLDHAASILACAFVKRILIQDYLQLVKVDWNWILTYYDTWVVFNVLNLSEPNVLSDVACREAFGRVCVKNFGH